MHANGQPTLRVQMTIPTKFGVYLTFVDVLTTSRPDADFVTGFAPVIAGRIGEVSQPAQTEAGA